MTDYNQFVTHRIMPDGWMRNPDTGRRRPEGDASREYVHW